MSRLPLTLTVLSFPSASPLEASYAPAMLSMSTPSLPPPPPVMSRLLFTLMTISLLSDRPWSLPLSTSISTPSPAVSLMLSLPLTLAVVSLLLPQQEVWLILTPSPPPPVMSPLLSTVMTAALSLVPQQTSPTTTTPVWPPSAVMGPFPSTLTLMSKLSEPAPSAGTPSTPSTVMSTPSAPLEVREPLPSTLKFTTLLVASQPLSSSQYSSWTASSPALMSPLLLTLAVMVRVTSAPLKSMSTPSSPAVTVLPVTLIVWFVAGA